MSSHPDDPLPIVTRFASEHGWLRRPELDGAHGDVWERPDGKFQIYAKGANPQIATLGKIELMKEPPRMQEEIPPLSPRYAIGELGVARRHLHRLLHQNFPCSPMMLNEISQSVERCVKTLEAMDAQNGGEAAP